MTKRKNQTLTWSAPFGVLGSITYNPQERLYEVWDLTGEFESCLGTADNIQDAKTIVLEDYECARIIRR